MKIRLLVFFILISFNAIGQVTTDKNSTPLNSKVEGIGLEQFFFLITKDNIIELDSAIRKIIKPKWVKSIEVVQSLDAETNDVDFVKVYIQLKRSKEKELLRRIEN